MKTIAGSFLILLCLTQTVLPQPVISTDAPDAGLKSRVDLLAGAIIAKDGPGFTVAVVRNQNIILKAAYGRSNLEQGSPLTTESLFNIGSVSKHFTAWAVLLLEQRGLLSIADDIRTHLPELPDYGKPITISHLLYQTSGLPEYLRLFRFAGIFYDDRRRFDDLHAMLMQKVPVNFPSGTQWQYSNTNYALLAEIVRRVTGKNFDVWIQENLFQPAGMHNTLVPVNNRMIVRHMAESYARVDGTIEKRTAAESIPGPTLVCTNAGDMAHWMMHFKNNPIGGRDLFDRLCNKGKLENGREIPYSMGIARGKYRGIATIGHSGDHGGFIADMTYCPELDLGVFVAGNFAEFRPIQVRNAILDYLLFHESAPAPSKSSTPSAGSQGSANPMLPPPTMLGNYRVDGKEDILTFFVEQGRLWGNYLGVGNVELYPRDDQTFANRESDIVFRTLDSAAGTAELNLKGSLLKITRISSSQTDKNLTTVAGRYYSDILDAVYSIILENGALILKQRRSVGTHTLTYAAGNTLVCSLGELRMTFDAGGKAIGFMLWHETVNSIPFSKIGN